jgi:hypothetical protein
MRLPKASRMADLYGDEMILAINAWKSLAKGGDEEK